MKGSIAKLERGKGMTTWNDIWEMEARAQLKEDEESLVVEALLPEDWFAWCREERAKLAIAKLELSPIAKIEKRLI